MSEDEQTENDNESGQSESPVDEKTLKEAEEKVSSVEQRYIPGSRPTVVVEGTGGTVAGTAFASDEDIEKHQSETSEDSDEDDDK